MTTPPSLVSVVLSFRNEKEVIPELITRLRQALNPLPVEHELIFVNDASTDGSLSLLTQKAQEDRRIKIINMSRRFGVSECVLAGMAYAQGEAIVYMDADLQDPPEVIPELIEKWQQGADVVYTVRASRAGESALKLRLTRWGYRLIASASEIDLPVEAGDFKLLSRRVVNELLKLNERPLYLRGMVNWVGFKQVPVLYHRQERAAGQTHFPLFRHLVHDFLTLHGPVGTLISGVASFSLLPLTIFLPMGLVICALALVFLIAAAVMKFSGTPLPDWPWIMTVVLCLSGVQFLGLGTLGLYLGQVYNAVRSRPHYIVESTIGFERQDSK